jgi:DNA-binding response OmpR family regulator
MRILLLDDVDELRFGLLELLELEGYEVIACSDGDEAWIQFQQERPHVVITDVMHPGIDGLELCYRVRTKGSTPVMVLTSAINLEKSAFAVGANMFMLKPVDPDDLLAGVALLARRARGEEPIY